MIKKVIALWFLFNVKDNNIVLYQWELEDITFCLSISWHSQATPREAEESIPEKAKVKIQPDPSVTK